MITFFKKFISDNRAFTLIELLVVIAIIGTLSTIAFISLSGANESAKDTKKIANIRQLQTALLQYRAQEGKIPVIEAGLEGETSKCIKFDSSKPLESSLKDFAPNFDYGDADYFYAMNKTGSEYILGVKLANKNEVLQNDIDDEDYTNINITFADDEECKCGEDPEKPETGWMYCVSS